MKSQVLLIWMI